MGYIIYVFNNGGLMSKIQKFNDYLETSWYQPLLDEGSFFYREDACFMFTFRPDGANHTGGDEELIEAEKTELAARLNADLARYAETVIDKWNEEGNRDGYVSYSGPSFSLEKFISKIQRQYKDDKIQCLFLYGDGEIGTYNLRENNRLNLPYSISDDVPADFAEMLFKKAGHILSDKRIKQEKTIRKNTAREIIGEFVEHSFTWNRQWFRDYQREHDHHPDETIHWLKIVVKEYKGNLWRQQKAAAYKKYEDAISDYAKFSKLHKADIVSIANYMSSEELQEEGRNLKQLIPDLRNAHLNLPKPTLTADEIEVDVQKAFKKKVTAPVARIQKKLAKIQLPEDLVSYLDAKVAILDRRAEEARIAEEKRLAEEEAIRQARQEKQRACIANYMLMLRGSGHGHGHKDHEGNEKLWYETKAAAVEDAIKIAKKKGRLLEPYKVTLRTEMDQPIAGWFLTTVDREEES